MWSKLSSAGQFLYREETRAARVSLVVVTMVSLAWAPEAGLRVIGVMARGQSAPGAASDITLQCYSAPALAAAAERGPGVPVLRPLPRHVLPEVSPGPEGGQEGVGAQAQAPETEQTPADAGQAQVPQLPPPGARLVPESTGEHHVARYLVITVQWSGRPGHVLPRYGGLEGAH